jgi:hypothetical protein
LLERARRANHKTSSTFDRSALTAIDPQSQSTEAAKPSRREFTLYRNAGGEIVCREATPDEIRERQQDLKKLGLRQINHFELDKSVSGQAPEAANLIIVLRATQQLQQNATATAAFNRAAQNWENVIKSPLTIYRIRRALMPSGSMSRRLTFSRSNFNRRAIWSSAFTNLLTATLLEIQPSAECIHFRFPLFVSMNSCRTRRKLALV